MKKQGTVVKWNSDKAFGFIRSPDTAADIFFHRRDLLENRPPAVGQAVTFDEIHVGGKGPRALKVELAKNRIETAAAVPEDNKAAILPRAAPAGERAEPLYLKQREQRLYWTALGLMGFWLLLWLIGIGIGRFPWVVLTGLALLNLATFYVYWRDKEAAIQGSWRASENQLHGLAVLGGWPGAWFAQQILRHKSSKQAFRVVYWATVALNILGLLAWLIWPAFQGTPAV
jgi:uncharacterized membrane protein YsdA (DUF1294 family)/cold shock CspA family protein